MPALTDKLNGKSAGKSGQKPTEKPNYVKQYEDLAADPQYAIGKAPDTRATLQEAISRAEEAYQRQADVNDWAEVGQMLGKAAAQYAAAQSGMAKERNMGGLDTGPSIDYSAKSDRAFRRYQQAINNAQLGAGATSDQFRQQESAKKEAYERAAEPLKAGAQAEREASREASAERIASAREAERIRTEEGREAGRVRDLTVRDLEGEEKEAENRVRNAETLLANEEVLDDMSTKDASKLQTKYAAAAGAAGIDLARVKEEAEKSPEVDKTILGFIPYKGKDPSRYKNALRQEIERIKGELSAIREQKKATIGRQSRAAPPPSSETVRVQGPSGEVQEIKRTAWEQKYSKQKGYTLVGQ